MLCPTRLTTQGSLLSANLFLLIRARREVEMVLSLAISLFQQDRKVEPGSTCPRRTTGDPYPNTHTTTTPDFSAFLLVSMRDGKICAELCPAVPESWMCCYTSRGTKYFEGWTLHGISMAKSLDRSMGSDTAIQIEASSTSNSSPSFSNFLLDNKGSTPTSLGCD